MSDLDDLKTYLGHDADQWDDDALLGALAAETADQASRLRVPTPRPASVSEALWRRVARNLAMRTLPLGLTQSETGSMYLGSRDPEVRRLEAPYRKVVVG
jgi:hypothetical protein